MVRLQLRKKFTFEAAHQLPYHQGKCAREHGHSYGLMVTIEGELKSGQGFSDAGMILDFSRVSLLVKEHIIDKVDHYRLNDITLGSGITLPNPTAEHLILAIAKVLGLLFFAEGVYLHSLELWETENSSVKWEADQTGWPT